MVITEISIIHHVAIVIFLLWLLNSFNCCHPILYFVFLIYLYQVNERYGMRLRRKLQFQEKKSASQKRILTDSETVRWLNHAVEKMWPICIEQIVSQRIFLPIIPWFLEKYKPWTVKKAAVQRLYLGRRPPFFTEMRVLRDTTDDDHLVLELGLNFLTADDMGAILVAKLRKRLGFGMVAKMHLTGMHVEGKVLIGVKFLRSWPFIGRLRVCFAEPPYFQMTVKPLFHHGLDVTEVPGIAGWLDNLLAVAFEQTLVEPNMLVVDLEKFVSPESENWFSVDVKEAVAQVKVEVIEAAELKSADLNGLADPYLKGRLGPYRFCTQVQKKTLTPKWLEEFKVPICSWDSQNMLEIELRDKDRFASDDVLGKCSVNISELRGGKRHDIWLPLENVKTGRLHLAISVVEANYEVKDQKKEVKIEGEKPDSLQTEKVANPAPSSTPSVNKSGNFADTFEAIDVEGQKETGIWVHHPGSETSQAWEPRKGRSRTVDTEIQSRQSSHSSDTDSDDDTKEGSSKRGNILQRGLNKIFRRHSKKEHRSNSFKHDVPSPHPNVKPVHVKRVGVKLVMGDPTSDPDKNELKDTLSSEKDDVLEGDSSDDESSLSSSFRDHSVGGIPISSTIMSQVPNGEVEASAPAEAVYDSEGNKEVSIENK